MTQFQKNDRVIVIRADSWFNTGDICTVDRAELETSIVFNERTKQQFWISNNQLELIKNFKGKVLVDAKNGGRHR